MSPRNRKEQYKDLPDNTYPNKVGNHIYYYWEHPLESWREQLGKDQPEAIKQGIRLNRMLASMGINPSIRVKPVSGPTLGQAIKECRNKIINKSSSASTQQGRRDRLNRLDKGLGHQPVTISVQELSDFFEPMIDTAYVRLTHTLGLVFDHCYRRGYLPLNYQNPVTVLEKRTIPEAVRERLSLEMFKQIYGEASEALQITMDIMLHTTLRPGDVVHLRFDQISDNRIRVKTRKTGKAIAIKLSEEEEDLIIKRAKRTGIVSPFVVHRIFRVSRRKNTRQKKDHPTQLTVPYLSCEFRAIRDKLGICKNLSAAQRPSLYETRSLASVLFVEQGRNIEQIQSLMAHTGQDMTEHYIHNRRENYEEVEAGLSLELLGNTVVSQFVSN